MIKTGHYSDLTFNRDTPQGWYLVDEIGVEVLLPNKYCPTDAQIGDPINVFIYRDSEDRLVATLRKPYVELNEFACLEVVATTGIGAFLDWGMEKDLFVPFKEQHRKLIEGEYAVVFMYHDEITDRLIASAKVAKWLIKEEVPISFGTEVNLLCFDETEIGYRMIVNQKYQGMVYKNEIFQGIEVGDQGPGWVRLVRENGLIDLSITPIGYKKVEGISVDLLQTIKENNGFLALTDKSSSELIQSQLGMSKKAFKVAVGKLYKSRQIILEETGIRLID